MRVVMAIEAWYSLVELLDNYSAPIVNILLRLFSKLLRLICFCNYRHYNALSVFVDVDRAL